ncbi:MAG: response regulator [Verrucomicrobiota bacterium]
MKRPLSADYPGRIPEDWENRIKPRLLREFPNILLVDDSEFLSDILATFFRLEGFSAVAACGGLAALKAVEKQVPDIAFIDIVMPDLGGLEVAKRIRATARGKAPLLVALSGWHEQEVRDDAKSAGFDHFLIKPVDPASLRQFLSGLSTNLPE